MDDDYNWFYTKKIPYFLEDNNKTDKEIINKNSMEYKSFTNVHNLGEKKKNNEGKKMDCETTLMMGFITNFARRHEGAVFNKSLVISLIQSIHIIFLRVLYSIQNIYDSNITRITFHV